MRISSEEQSEKEIRRASENRLKRGLQQREANHKGSAKEEGASDVLRPRKIQTFFSQSLFDICFSL